MYKKIFLTAVIALLSQSSFAAEKKCLNRNEILDHPLVKINKQGAYWISRPNIFIQNGWKWSIVYYSRSITAQDPQEALNLANAKYKTLDFDSPEWREFEGQTWCDYPYTPEGDFVKAFPHYL